MVSPTRRRDAVDQVERRLAVSQRRACRTLEQPRSTQRYRAQRCVQDRPLVQRILELVRRHPRYGYRRVTALLRGEGRRVNRKRVYRLWRQEGLRVPKKQRKKRRLGRSANGLIFGDGQGSGAPWREPFVVLTRCTFDRAEMTLSDCLVTLRDCLIEHSPRALILRGYANLVEANTVIGEPLVVIREGSFQQPLFIDGIHAGDVTNDGGLWLEPGNYFLGPNNIFQNNLYPVRVNGGLLAGSAVPATGNTINRIVTLGHGGVRTWADVGVPYLVDGFTDAGILTIQPEVTVEFLPPAGLIFSASNWLTADGLPEAPITFRGYKGQQWESLLFAHQIGPRMEYCNFTTEKSP